MFSGIVQAVGSVTDIAGSGPGRHLRIDTGSLDMAGFLAGASLCVNGVCLTATVAGKGRFEADVSEETLACTNLGGLAAGSPVNLERAIAAGAPVDGHFVTGHVDGIGRVVDRTPSGGSVRMSIEAPDSLSRFICRKGSICVDGVSLTVNEAGDRLFDVNFIPHTLGHTIASTYVPGSLVNLEVDVIARYLARLAAFPGQT